MSTEIHFAPSAALKVAELIAEKQNPALCLRLYIKGGGCSGFEYQFMLDAQKNTDDAEIKAFVPEKNCEVSLIIDPTTLLYLGAGSTVSYKEDLTGAGFQVYNPNAETTCGCGSSFSIT